MSGTGVAKVGLVLGGGGSVGLAYHAGALTALENDLGWDARTASVVVGTSAGSIIGAAVRSGVPASDLAALAVGARTRETPWIVRRSLQTGAGPAPQGTWSMIRPLRPPSPGVVTEWLRRPWRWNTAMALAAVLPEGTIDLESHLRWVDHAMGGGWPDEELWICAARQRDLRRVVFGRDSFPPASAAVAASCAVPGIFRPVVVEGEPCVDGGVSSPTNADVLRGSDLDLAIVVSPMSGRAPVSAGPERLVRDAARRRVHAERVVLERAGVATLVIEPGPDVRRVMGLSLLRADRLDDVVREAFLDTGDQVRSARGRRLLAGLDRAAGRKRTA